MRPGPEILILVSWVVVCVWFLYQFLFVPEKLLKFIKRNSPMANINLAFVRIYDIVFLLVLIFFAGLFVHYGMFGHNG